jgi:hypothetical protein
MAADYTITATYVDRLASEIDIVRGLASNAVVATSLEQKATGWDSVIEMTADLASNEFSSLPKASWKQRITRKAS